MKALLLLSDGASRAVRITGELMAWSGLLLVLVVAFNVLARYLFSYSSVALQEAEWHLMAAAALFGMSYGLNQGGEVRVDIFYSRFSHRLQAFVNVVAYAVLLAISIFVVWLSAAYVASSYAINEGSPDPGGLPFRYVLKAAVPAAFVLLALQSFAMLLRDICVLTGAVPAHGASSSTELH